jgi:zinc transport system substrate-binding protein
VVASFYPLQFAAQRVAGNLAAVDSLTKPGAEPHDLELTPKDVARVGSADLVVYLGGFQPAVDDAIKTQPPKAGLDVTGTAKLNLTYTPIEEGAQATDEAGSTDPHFWLDPTRLAAVGDALAAELGKIRPADVATFDANAAALRTDLESLDAEFAASLSSCANKDLVTSHNAFGYLAQRYGLTQQGITGLTPEHEPDPKALAGVTSFVRANQVRTIYYETLVSPDIAEVVANETGARTAVLDPIEGLNDQSQGNDYLEVMRANLANLKAGQPCP